MSLVQKIGHLVAPRTALLVCDMQEKFRFSISHFNAVVSVSNRLIQVAKLLQMPVIITEMYPKGLGHTVPELGDLSGLPCFPKMTFSMIVKDVEETLQFGSKIDSVLLCGIETHVCVQRTALDLLERGVNVHCIADACSSRSQVDRMYALKRMRQAGAFITTSESAILGLMSGADHPLFRQVQKIIIPPTPDSGLCPTAEASGYKQD